MEMSVFTTNRKARHDYEIISTLEVGMELLGHEVKSIRIGRMILNNAYGVIKDGELWLLNGEIPPYQPANLTTTYLPTRTRRLLIAKADLEKLAQKIDNDKLILVPLSVYEKNKRIKLELALARPRKNYDKREAIKKRDISRAIGYRLK